MAIQLIVYVSDAAVGSRFYADLLGLAPVFESPRFVAFDIAEGAQLAVWSGAADRLAGNPVRTSEVCLTVTGGPAAVDQVFDEWIAKGAVVVTEPHDDVFGRTFVVADPDGNLLRVAPVD